MPSDQLNVHIVTHNDMDGFLWGILEGWLVSGLIPNQIKARVSGPLTYLDQAPDFWETLPTTDAVLLCVTSAAPSNLARAVKVIEKYNLWSRTIFHDYRHDLELRAPGIAKKCARVLVGKRLKYLRCCKGWLNAQWFPRTGIQERVLRYAPTLPWTYWKDIPAIAVYHVFKPAQKHRIKWMDIVRKTLPKSVVGSIANDGLSPARLQRTCGDRHIPNYLERVSRARIGVYLMGGNALGHQFWEFAALRCAILAAHPSLHPAPEEKTQEWQHFDPPLIENEDFFYFRNGQELQKKLLWMATHWDVCEQMAERVWRKVQSYRSVARSERIYQMLRELAGWQQTII